MEYLFLLSQEHTEMPRAEVEAVLNAEDVSYNVVGAQDHLLRIDADRITAEQVDRLAMTFEVCELITEFSPENYQKLAAKNITVDTSFAVRKAYIDDTAAPEVLEQNVGRIIDRSSAGHVNLDQPETVFRIYLYHGQAILCKMIADIDRSQYESRKNQYRPFSSPVSLHPRLARTLVNLSEAPQNGTVLDPFCGTGGILIEAGLIGCETFGLDIQEEMVDGCKNNLEGFDIRSTVQRGAFEDILDHFGDDIPFDAVVTDLPYGKASKVEGNPVTMFLDTAADLTSGKTVFMTDQDELNGLEPAFHIYVHRSLTRYVYILD